MINIREAVEKLLEEDYEAQKALARGLMNLSQYARSIRKEVEEYTKKEVGIQSIVVTLARLEKKAKSKKKVPDVEIQQLAVQSQIVQLVYPKNRDSLQSLTDAIQATTDMEDVFFSFSTGTKDIALVISEKLEDGVAQKFSAIPILRKKGLSALSIRFHEQLVREPNIGLVLLQKIASRNIVLDAETTTYNEFTLVFESKYLQSAIEALGTVKNH